MLRKKFIAVATSAALAVSLCPGLAVASTVTAGSIDTDAAAKTVSTQGKVKVKVLDGYQYNEKGLLKSYNGYRLSYNHSTWNLRQANNDAGTKITIKSSNNLIKKATLVSRYKIDGKNYKEKDIYTYTYSGDNVTSEKVVRASTMPYSKRYQDTKKYRTENTTYTLASNGRVARAVTNWSQTDKSSGVTTPTKYTYDKLGNLQTIQNGRYHRSKYTNYYAVSVTNDPGRITGRTYKTYNADTKKFVTQYTTSYTYKTIKVPASMVKAVKAQQWAIINQNLNNALGPIA